MSRPLSTTVWVNPNKEPKHIPTRELEPLPDISEAEMERLTQNNRTEKLKELKNTLKERFKDRLITNKHSQNHILINVDGINRSIFQYSGRPANQITKRSLFYLNKILLDAVPQKPEPNKYKNTNNKNKQNFDSVQVYNAKYKLNGKTCAARIVVRIYPPTKRYNYYKHNFHVASVQYIKVEPVLNDGDGPPKRASEHLSTGSTNKQYPPNGSESSETQKSMNNERYSYCELALDHCKQHGELPLCPIPKERFKTRRKWLPMRLARLEKVEKSYDLKTGERWITVHPNGDQNKGQPLLIKENSDGTASVIAGAGGKLNGLRLRKHKNKEEYHAQVKARREKLNEAKAERRAKESEYLSKLSKKERRNYKDAKKQKRVEKQSAEQALKDEAREADIQAAREIAETHGWEVEDLQAKFDQGKNDLEARIKNASREDKGEWEHRLAQHEAARKIALHRQAKNVLAAGKAASNKLRERMLIDDSLRDMVRERLADPKAGAVNTELRTNNRNRIDKNYKTELSEEEHEYIQADHKQKLREAHGEKMVKNLKAAQASQKERNEIVQANFSTDEYATPQDTETRIATLKKLMELEKKQESIPSEHLGVLYSSIRASLGIDEYANLDIEADNEPGNATIEITRKGMEPKLLKFEIDLRGRILLGNQIEDVDIFAPQTTISIGFGSQTTLAAPIYIEAKSLRIGTDQIIVKGSHTAKHVSDDMNIVEIHASERLERDVFKPPILYNVSLKVAWARAESFPWQKYQTAISNQEGLDSQTNEGILKLKRILRLFRSHGKNQLAKYKDAIEHKRKTYGAGASVLDQLINDSVLTLYDHIYVLDPNRLAEVTGLAYKDFYSSETPPKTVEFIQKALKS